jgi:hypothetical protein
MHSNLREKRGKRVGKKEKMRKKCLSLSLSLSLSDFNVFDCVFYFSPLFCFSILRSSITARRRSYRYLFFMNFYMNFKGTKSKRNESS